MSALMSCLLREGAIDAATTEAVIERQVAAGGRLDTALLELDVVEENPLLGFYASACGLEPVTRRDLLRVSLAALQLLPRQLADVHRAVPLGLVNQRLRLAFSAPPPDSVVEHLEFELGQKVEVLITLDIGVAEALERYYGVALSHREELLLATLNRRPRGQLVSAEAGTVPSRERSLTPRYGFQIAASTHRTGPGDPEGVILAARRVVESADGVEQVFDALRNALAPYFDTVAFFVREGDEVRGVATSGDREAAQRVSRLVYPTSVTSFFARALGALRPVRVDPSGGLDRLVLGDLGIKSINGVWCFPFAEAGSVRALAVVAGGPVSGDPEALAPLRELSRPVARAMVRLGTWGPGSDSEASGMSSAQWATLQGRTGSTFDPRQAGEPFSWKRSDRGELERAGTQMSFVSEPIEGDPVLRTAVREVSTDLSVSRELYTEPPSAMGASGEMQANVDRLVHQLLSCQPTEVEEIVERLVPLGDVAVHVLGERFPGPLWWNPEGGVVPLGPEISAVAFALTRFGTAAFNGMRHHLESDDAITRLCALAWAGHVLGEELIPWLGGRVFDVNESIRDVATELLFRRAECGEEYEAAVSAIRATARVHRPQVDVRSLAIRALGQLRDVHAIGLLIDLVGDLESSIAEAAQDALITITGQALGASAREWWTWVDANGDKDRVRWLIDGLNGEREEARQRAAQELERLTNHYVGYHAALPPKQRVRCQAEYLRWWTTHMEQS